MSVRVQIPPQLRQQTEGQAEIQASGATVQAVLDDLAARFPALTQRILDQGQVRRFLNVYLNSEHIRYLETLSPPVKEGDELAIIPAVAGG